MRSYANRVRALLSPAEQEVFKKLSTPQKIQTFLDRFPVNFETGGETLYSPRLVLKKKTMHCAEGALFAAASLAYHGRPPLLMDFRTLPKDEDHVVALFKEHGLWGAISKTNHAVLKWRDPIYKSPRELGMSYAHEYYLWSGKKSLKEFSKPFDLRRYHQKWVVAEEGLFRIIEKDLEKSPHFPIAPAAILKNRRKAYPIELKALKLVEYKDPRKKKRG